MEILVLELNLVGEKTYTLGFVDIHEVLHELNPYQLGGNNNELNKDCVVRWVYFSDVIKRCEKDIFEDFTNGCSGEAFASFSF